MTRDVITLCPLTATMAGGSSSRRPASPRRRPASPRRRSASPRRQHSSPQRGSVFGLPLTYSNREDREYRKPSESRQEKPSRRQEKHTLHRDSRITRSPNHHSSRRQHDYENSPPLPPVEQKQPRRPGNRSQSHPDRSPTALQHSPHHSPQRNPSGNRDILDDPENHPLDPDNPPADLYEAEARMRRIEAFLKAILDVESVKARSGKKKGYVVDFLSFFC